MTIAILGLGEAGSRFAHDLAQKGVKIIGFDPKFRKVAEIRNPSPEIVPPSVSVTKSNREAAEQADIILSVNLSTVSEDVAKEVLPVLNSSKIYAEMNTSSPQKKQKIYDLLKNTGVQYVDLAIMAPVPPKGIMTPFWLSGNGAQAFYDALKHLNLNMKVLSDEVGEASKLKLLRSIVYKGVAAVICEAVEAGQAFGLEPYIREQIKSIIGHEDDALIDHFIKGSKTHAQRRMHEMEAVCEMLKTADIEPFMSQAAYENLNKLSK
jgi:3-hydroxyisobutyrate dehydrogenase-like beta-hydroxyacid dehydrogenase